jgi:mannose-6-phosphate isomerase-like protein (cupin superfamily)
MKKRRTKKATAEEHDNFYTFRDYNGKLANDDEGVTIYGFSKGPAKLPATGGACFGLIESGGASIKLGVGRQLLYGPTWFTTEAGLDMLVFEGRVLVIQKPDYVGMNVAGQLQDYGRLNYINGAKDTQLFGPLRFGEPVCNALYMTPGIHQTMHTHPSTRAGIIVAGKAFCETPSGKHALEPGVIFYLPTNGRHKFRTDETGEPLILFAWHPDSDFGPKDEDHPMLNRTMVEGVSAKSDELAEIRTAD